MLTFVSIRLKSWRWMKTVSRSHATKSVQAQRMNPQEFSFDNYDCIGFDLDHTLCRYNLKPLYDLIYKTLASFLIEKYDYPNELSEVSEADFSFSQKGIVLDKRRGNFLKLDGQYRIVQATHGTRLLSEEDISRIYGFNQIWEESKGVPHKLVMRNAMDEPFYVFKDFFVTPGAAICAKVVDIIDHKNGRSLENYNFWHQFVEGILYMYERENFKNNSGKFFPQLKSNPGIYYKPCSENVKNWLANMCQDKVTFLLTSANFDVAEFAAEFCLGEDWKKYFDLIVTFAQKPGFFWKDKPFYTVREDTEIKGVKPVDMKSNIIYTQGNFKDLLEVCAILAKVERPKVAYFGDSLLEDVYAASELAGCDTIAIVEEMLAEGMDNMPDQHDAKQVLLSSFWGSFFSYKTSDKELVCPNSLWTYLLSRHSRLTIPSLDSISKLQLRDRITCFNNCNSTVSGFYPGVPKALCFKSVDEKENQQISKQAVTRTEKIPIHSRVTGIL